MTGSEPEPAIIDPVLLMVLLSDTWAKIDKLLTLINDNTRSIEANAILFLVIASIRPWSEENTLLYTIGYCGAL